MFSGVCPARFGVHEFCSVVLGCWWTPYTTGPCSQWCRFLTGGVFSVTLRIVDLWQYCVRMLHKIRCNPMYFLYMELYQCRMCQCWLHAVLWYSYSAHRYSYSPPRCRISQHRKPLFSSRCPCGTILLTLYLMVCDWRVSRAGPMLIYWHDLSCSNRTLKKIMIILLSGSSSYFSE